MQTIEVDDEAFARLVSYRRDFESASDVIKRVVPLRGDPKPEISQATSTSIRVAGLVSQASGCDVRGELLSDGRMRVLKGSKFSPHVANSLDESNRKLRKKLQSSGSTLTEDYDFSSPSRALSVMAGAQISGQRFWFQDGRSLASILSEDDDEDLPIAPQKHKEGDYGVSKKALRERIKIELMAGELQHRQLMGRLKNHFRDDFNVLDRSYDGELSPLWEHRARFVIADMREEGILLKDGDENYRRGYCQLA